MKRALLIGLSLPVVVWLVVRTVGASGAGWSEAGRIVLGLDPLWWPGLAVVWWAGHCARAAQVMACLPRLCRRRALSLCFAGSAIANSLPLGGALSYGVSAAMLRSWGHDARATAGYFTLNQIYTVLLRVGFGVVSLGWFLGFGPGPSVGAAPVLVSIGTAVLLLALGAALSRGRGRIVAALRADIGITLRRSWFRLALSGLTYMLLLGGLLHLCLLALGVTESFGLILAVVGIERLVTTVPITPGGAGAAELTILTCLTAAGADPGRALAGALLYRFFTFLLEIPVGVAVIVLWRLRLWIPRTSAMKAGQEFSVTIP